MGRMVFIHLDGVLRRASGAPIIRLSGEEPIMSIELVRQRLDALFTDPSPRIGLISGPWGCGKTHQWLEARERHKDFGRPTLYVSLFGVRDLRGIERALARELAAQAARKTLTKSPGRWRHKLKIPGISTSTASLLTASAVAEHYVDHHRLVRLAHEVSVDLMLSALDGAVVVFDDLERRESSSLPMRELLGWLHTVKENKRCRILLIANTQGLGDGEKKDLALLREKVIDEDLSFTPTASQALNIAFKDVPHTLAPDAHHLRENCEKLGITNIRVLLRIVRLANEMLGLLSTAHAEVRRAALHTIALMGASHWLPQDGFPKTDYLMTFQMGYSGLLESVTDPPPEDEAALERQRWRHLLENYGYHSTDDLDKEIGRSVSRGFFDTDAMQRLAATLSDHADRAQRREALRQAWKPFQHSIKGDSAAMLDRILERTRNCLDIVAIADLVPLHEMLEAQGRSDDAETLFQSYIQAQPGPNEDRLEDLRLAGEKIPAGIRERLRRHFAGAVPSMSPREALHELAVRQPHRTEWIEAVQDLSREEVKQLMLQACESDFDTLMRGLAKLGQIPDAGAQASAVEQHMRDILNELAAEDPVMAYRVRPYRSDQPPRP